MIYLDESPQQQAQFENLLEQTKISVLDQLKTVAKPGSLTGAEFELIVYENMVIHAKQTPFDGKLRHTEDREFPDIVTNGHFGVEVKSTKKDDWTSIGNSVLESSRVPGVEKIYMFFGKLGGIPDIQYRDYSECLKGISVTHYPRYQVDMLLRSEHSIFNKMNTNYDTIRKSKNPVSPIRTYYKKHMKAGDALWWIGDDAEDMLALSPVIKNFSTLDKEAKESIKVDLLINFPEVFTASSKKYERIPAYLASHHGVVTSNVRDIFSAGGQKILIYNGQNFKVPKVIGEMLRLAPKISNKLNASGNKAEQEWLTKLDSYSAHNNLPQKLSEIYHNYVN